jgi:hypothetical protein
MMTIVGAAVVVIVWVALAAKWASDSRWRQHDDAKKADAILTQVCIAQVMDEVIEEIANR